MTLGLTLSEAKSSVTGKARNVIYYRKTAAAMTRRSDEEGRTSERATLKGWIRVESRRGERKTRLRGGGCNARDDPRAEIRRRAAMPCFVGSAKGERGEEEGAKGIPRSALWGSVNATLKSAYKSLRRRFPSARRVPIGLKFVRPTAPAVLFIFARIRRRRLFVSPSSRTLTRRQREGFFRKRCVSANRFNCHKNIVPLIVMIPGGVSS